MLGRVVRGVERAKKVILDAHDERRRRDALSAYRRWQLHVGTAELAPSAHGHGSHAPVHAKQPLPARKHELIAVRILEDREGAPRLLLRLRSEFHASFGELLVGFLHVVAGECAIERHAGLEALLVESEENDTRFGRSGPKLDPALLIVERLIGEDLEADALGPELESAVLVMRRDADELDVRDYAKELTTRRTQRSFFRCSNEYHRQVKRHSIDSYVVDTLMADIVGHDRRPSAFLVYLHLWCRASCGKGASVSTSHQDIADSTGLSKSAVQAAIRLLLHRRLIQSRQETVTAVPRYTVSRGLDGEQVVLDRRSRVAERRRRGLLVAGAEVGDAHEIIGFAAYQNAIA